MEEVLREYGIHPKKSILKPDKEDNDKSYSAAKVQNYKSDAVRELLKDNPTINHVKLWDDRQDNIDKFRRLKKDYKHINFEIFKVGDEVLSKQARSSDIAINENNITDLLDKFGFNAFQQYQTTAEQGIDFISSSWSSCLGISKEIGSKLVMTFGSFPFHRIGDVDLCLLAPVNLHPDECIVKLESELLKRGIRHIHCATGIRCPRLKLQLRFLNASPVEFDIVFAPCLPELNAAIPDTATLYQNSSKEVKFALEGVLFLQQVCSCIEGKISIENFGKLVDLIVLFLKRKHLKGNAFHCIRTFHIVRVLGEMFRKSKNHGENLCDYFRNSLTHLSTLDAAYWKRICKDFVPDETVARTVKHFTEASELINESASLSTVFAFVQFPLPMYVIVSVSLKSNVDELLWRACTMLEARIGTCVRKLLSTGVDVMAGPSDYSSIVRFAVPRCEWNIDVCKRTLSSLKSDAFFMQNKDNLQLIIDIN